MKTLAVAVAEYAPIHGLETILSRTTLSRLRHTLLVGKTISFISAITLQLLGFSSYSIIAYGVGMVCMALWLEQLMLYSYHNYYYFRGLTSLIDSKQSTSAAVTTYEVAASIRSYPYDLTAAFCLSPLGQVVLARSGVLAETVTQYLASERMKLSATSVLLEAEKVFTLIDLGTYIHTHDQTFASMLTAAGVQSEHFLQSLSWVIGDYHKTKHAERWWNKDSLSRITPIGQEWSYGATYLLEQFSRSIMSSSVFSVLTKDEAYASEKITELEIALQKNQAGNALIIGEAGVGTMDIVAALMRRIKNGTAIGSVANQHFFVLDTNRLLGASPTHEELEQLLLNLLSEAIEAGDCVLIIENLSTVITQASEKGIQLAGLIDEFLATPLLHIIATDTPQGFHTTLEPQGALLRRFTEIVIAEPDLAATTRLLQPIAIAKETVLPVWWTYAGLHAVSTSADRYLVHGAMPDKAISLLETIAVEAAARGNRYITEDVVYQIVSDKTGVPAGPVTASERELLLHLEAKLQQSVIGQQEALGAIARTMRRARVGIQASDKPIGSFLFLGPTGVGKTETAKALASVFFGSEKNLSRLDMSEFSSPESLERLLGTTEQSGLLPDLLRDHPYSVVLLDEFEKAHRTVHDLFLQILDEGIFTDGRGSKVNARNAIIIATSNAGSQLILKTVEQRKEVAALTQEIITHIITRGEFRPELLNRFDSVIIFEPLQIPEQLRVAQLQLTQLYTRIKDRGYSLSLSDDLVLALAQKGYSPEFGARPMQRVIQDIVEEKVAQKIISGEAEKGTLITLSRSDFTETELSR